jgi:hypothetical protein
LLVGATFTALSFTSLPLLAAPDRAADALRERAARQIIVLVDPSDPDVKAKVLVKEIKDKKLKKNEISAALGSPIDAEMLLPQGPTITEQQTVERAPRSTLSLLFNYLVLTYDTEDNKRTQKALLKQQKSFLHVEDNNTYILAALPSEQNGLLGANPVAAPQDTDAKQWGMHAMKFPDAWDRVRGHTYVGVLKVGLHTID